MTLILTLLAGIVIGVVATLAKIVFDNYWQWAGSRGPFSAWAAKHRGRRSN